MSKPTPRKGRKKNTVVRARQLENASLGLRHLGFYGFANLAAFRKAQKAGPLPDRYIIGHYPHPSLFGTRGFKERL